MKAKHCKHLASARLLVPGYGTNGHAICLDCGKAWWGNALGEFIEEKAVEVPDFVAWAVRMERRVRELELQATEQRVRNRVEDLGTNLGGNRPKGKTRRA